MHLFVVYRLGYDYTGGVFVSIYTPVFGSEILADAVVEEAAVRGCISCCCYIFVFGALLGSSIRSESSGKLIGSILRA